MIEEGYIKFNCNFVETPNLGVSAEILHELIDYRKKLMDLGLIGALEDGTGFGNLSHRISENSFLISASASGHIAEVNADHFSLVTDWNIEKNWISCAGKMEASSESLTHAAIYQSLSCNNAVIHIHSKDLWNRYLGKYLTTSKESEYGTVAIANEISNLVQNHPENKIIILGGHEDGIVMFGKSLEMAYSSVLNLLHEQ